MILPWEVIADEFEQQEALSNAMEEINEAFFPTIAFVGGIDPVRFDELEVGPKTDRYGIVLLSIGHVGTPIWNDVLSFSEEGDVTNMEWNEYGEILLADVVINVDYAYDETIVKKILIHSLGHTLGLDHDGDSVDLNSCMSSPQNDDCVLLESDVNLVLETYQSIDL